MGFHVRSQSREGMLFPCETEERSVQSNVKKILAAMAAILILVAGSATAETTMYAAIQSGTLNIRTEPWGEVSGWLCAGDSVTAEDEKDGWVLVTGVTESGSGWVKSEYLTCNLDGCGQYMNVSGGRLHVRMEPGGKHIRWLKDSATVTVTVCHMDDDGEMWGFIGDGYVLLSFMDKIE